MQEREEKTKTLVRRVTMCVHTNTQHTSKHGIHNVDASCTYICTQQAASEAASYGEHGGTGLTFHFPFILMQVHKVSSVCGHVFLTFGFNVLGDKFVLVGSAEIGGPL